MSAPGNTPRYLTGQNAKDVSAITGTPWFYNRVESRGPQVPYLPIADAWEGFCVNWAIASRVEWLRMNQC